MRRCLLVSHLVPLTAKHAPQWPQFRGPGATGVGADLRVPDTWSARPVSRDRDQSGLHCPGSTLRRSEPGQPAEAALAARQLEWSDDRTEDEIVRVRQFNEIAGT